MTTYLWITQLNGPIDLGKDDAGRVMMSSNFDARSRNTDTSFVIDLVDIIHNEGLAVKGTNLFYGGAVNLPQGDGPIVLILFTGGYPPDETHNGDKYLNPSCQILVHGKSYAATDTLARQINDLLDGTRNLTT